MSRTVNKVTLIGNLGQDPEVRSTSTGSRIAKVSLATSDYRGKDRDNETNWHRLTFFGRLVDVVEQYVRKGDRLFIEGRLSYSQTTGEDGVTRYWTEVIVNEMVMLGGNAEGGGSRAVPGQRGGYQTQTPTEGPGESAPPISEPDDDLPF